ncbi:hypothetical protein LZ009_09675 [Ramlibacter sp. XY19]|nr:hypothetical protein [Ramlibacter paludis]MCG2593049.1 hypothetical protein [Ramlibacter paludis]
MSAKALAAQEAAAEQVVRAGSAQDTAPLAKRMCEAIEPMLREIGGA